MGVCHAAFLDSVEDEAFLSQMPEIDEVVVETHAVKKQSSRHRENAQCAFERRQINSKLMKRHCPPPDEVATPPTRVATPGQSHCYPTPGIDPLVKSERSARVAETLPTPNFSSAGNTPTCQLGPLEDLPAPVLLPCAVEPAD